MITQINFEEMFPFNIAEEIQKSTEKLDQLAQQKPYTTDFESEIKMKETISEAMAEFDKIRNIEFKIDKIYRSVFTHCSSVHHQMYHDMYVKPLDKFLGKFPLNWRVTRMGITIEPSNDGKWRTMTDPHNTRTLFMVKVLKDEMKEIRDQLEDIKTIKTDLLRETETLKKEKEEFAEEKLQHNEEKEELKKQLEEIRFMRREIQQEKERLELERLRREFEKEKELLKQEQQKLEEERVQVVMERGRLIAQKMGLSK